MECHYCLDHGCEQCRPSDAETVLRGLECDHAQMRECHLDCGHFTCSLCGVSWDEGAEK